MNSYGSVDSVPSLGEILVARSYYNSPCCVLGLRSTDMQEGQEGSPGTILVVDQDGMS